MPTSSPLDLKLVSCKEKLINLTRQNNLLFYKKRKTSSLVVKSENMQSFYDALLDEEKFRFWEIPEEEDEKHNESAESEQGALFPIIVQKEPQEEVDWMSIHPPENDEIVCEFSSNDELHKILKNLYRRAKTEYDERGLNIAYVFFGLMEWSEKQTSERVKSPIILVPIKIEHKSASESYHIIIGDEEVVLNPALRVKFKKDFKSHHLEVGRQLSAECIKNFASSQVAKGQFGSLLAYTAGGKFFLCEFALNDFQPEFKDSSMWYVSMGSGQLIVDPFLGLMRKVFWGDSPPHCNEGIFYVAWALQHAIELNPGGINGPLQIAVLAGSGGNYKACLLDDEKLGEHLDHVTGVNDYLAKYKDILQGKIGTQSSNPPEPPKNSKA